MSVFNHILPQIDNKDFSKEEVSFKDVVDGYEFSAYLYQKKDTDKLFVVLNGALDKDRKSSNIYHRWSWNNMFDGSVLYIADPTLFKYKEANLAWYIGDKNNQFHEFVKDFILKIASKLHIDQNQLVLYGSSGGGFASLKLAGMIGNGALAVTINPQVKVFDYVKKHVDEYLNICWNQIDVKAIETRIEFDSLRNVQNSSCRVLFIQNLEDKFHYKNHFIPFLETLNIFSPNPKMKVEEQSSRIRYMVYDHPSGHAAEPKEMFPEILRNIDYILKNVSFSEKKFFIIGSSVSRDVFAGRYSNEISSNQYYPRTSFCRLALKPIQTPLDLSKIVSPFQRKIIKQDITSDLFYSLENTNFDYILIDLVDERYGLIQFANTFITNSYEVNVSGILGDVSQLNKIDVGSDQFYSLWKEGFEIFINYCKKNSLLGKVLINKVFWASMFDDASSIPNFSQDRIRDNNAVLEKLYKIIEEYIPDSNFITYPKSYFVAKKNHKWGAMPFHYVDSFYKHTYEELKKFN
ncbi:DUF6270 domain-containing protein [Acinetobacter proteolyticus]|uniref:DUF6270 domain-containing protein n=1 Tax=Acinetobacter proteolyticus TaxID=1776741 RepID=UPI003D98EA0F